MKKLMLIIALGTLFLFGCQDESSIVEPVDTQIQQPQTGKHWLTFSDNQKNSIEELYYLSKWINGTSGGGFYFHGTMSSDVYVAGQLYVPAGAYEGAKKMGVTLNSETVTADFSPSPTTFEKPVLYSIEYYGVDLSGINPNKVDFYYIDGNGKLVKAKYDNIVIDVDKGLLAVYKAQLPHFSRYGFVN